MQTLLWAYFEVENTSVSQANAELGPSSESNRDGSMGYSTNSPNYAFQESNEISLTLRYGS
jgi:hypothetical protein